MNSPPAGRYGGMASTTDRRRLLHSLEERLEAPMVVLSFVWLALFVAELVVGLGPVLTTAGTAIWAIFVVDFSLRLWLAIDRKSYLKRNWLTAISLLVPALRMFRAFRAVAILRGIRGVRAVRVAGSFNRALRALSKTFKRRGFGYVVAATGLVVAVGAAAMLAFERGAPGFGDYGESLWWAAMMVLSVGSDSWPVTPEGRALALFLALYGFTILGYVAATLTSFFLDRDADNHQAAVVGSNDLAALTQELQALRRELEQTGQTGRPSSPRPD